MYMIGDKVVPFQKTVGRSWDMCPQWNAAKRSDKKFLYVTDVSKDKTLLLSFNTEGIGNSWYHQDDVKPYIEEKNEGSTLLKGMNTNGKELLYMLVSGIIKEDDDLFVSRL